MFLEARRRFSDKTKLSVKGGIRRKHELATPREDRMTKHTDDYHQVGADFGDAVNMARSEQDQ